MSDMSPAQMNALTDLLTNLSPSLSLALSEQINQVATLEPLNIQAIPLPEVLTRTQAVFYTVFGFSSPLLSEGLLVLSEETACVLVDVLAGNPGTDPGLALTPPQIEAMSKVCSGLVRGLANALATAMGTPLDVETVNSAMGSITLPPVFAMDDAAIQATMTLTIENLPEMEITFLFTPDFVRGTVPDADTGTSAGDASLGGSNNNGLGEDDLAAMLSQLEGLGGMDTGGGSPPMGGGMPPMGGPAPFGGFGLPSNNESSLPRGVELILDIPLDVTVELGRVRMLIKDVLELASGSIVELDRVAGEPVDLLVNGRLIAKGEVVVIEDNFGIRLTEIISPADRIANLGKGR